jgi:hypothetical protein
MKHRQYKVVVKFTPPYVQRSFVVYATDDENAIRVANFDAMNLGFNGAWITGHTVEVL